MDELRIKELSTLKRIAEVLNQGNNLQEMLQRVLEELLVITQEEIKCG